MKKILDIEYNDNCALDIYLPEQAEFSTVIYFYGGGMVSGDRKKVSWLAESFVKAGFAFVAPNYRTYSEKETNDIRFPEYLQDAAQAVAYVKAHIREHGGNGKLYVTGSSAGGWISAMLCVNREYLFSVGVDNLEIDGWIIDSAQMTSHYNVQRFETGRDSRLQRIDEFAPLYYVDENTRFSKMLLLFYEDDMPCRVEQNRLFYKAVLAFDPNADIEYKLLPGGHCAGLYSKTENGEIVYVHELLEWIRRKYL